jgi:hypothetical protein
MIFTALHFACKRAIALSYPASPSGSMGVAAKHTRASVSPFLFEVVR